MINYFINYDADTDHLSISTFRNTGYANSDVLSLVDGIHFSDSGNCELEGAKEALEDGSIWMDEDEHIVNQLLNLIQEHEAKA